MAADIPTIMEQIRDMPMRNAIVAGMLLAQPGLVDPEAGTIKRVPLHPDLDLALTAVASAWMGKDEEYDDTH